MPKRSTPFQAIVRLVREHFAQSGVTITESKLLRDAVTGYKPEVDIVIEGELDGEPMVISVEVIEHSRKATIEWVHRMLRKHRDLPTNRLLLVSKSGFSRQALVAIEKEAGRVQALTPEIVEVDGEPVIKSLFVDQITTIPTGCTAWLTMESGERRSILGRIKRGWRTSSRRRISRAGGRRFARRPRQGRRWRARAERGHDHSQRASHCQGWIVG